MVMLQDRNPERKVTLDDLDLTEKDVHHALRAGDAEARTCTPLDPSIMAPWLMWGRTVAGLRSVLVPRGWTFSEVARVPRTTHPSSTFCIVVNAGDAGTGVLGLPVSTRRPRGEVGIQAIRDNQLSFFSNDEEPEEPALTTTWMLLVNRTPDIIRAELSLPSGHDGNGKITSWRHRIPITPISTDPMIDLDDSDDGPDFDFAVTRR